MKQGYIVPSDVLANTPPRAEWHGTSATGFDVWLVAIEWPDADSQDSFESIPGVVPLGNRWEPLPTEAVALLAALQTASSDSGAAAIGVPSVSEPLPASPDTVATALKKISWPGARMIG